MSEDVKGFINNVYSGNNVDAGQNFKDAIRAKVGDALENRRKEMAQNMFKAQQGEFDEAPHNEPKPEIADTGTFAPDGTVINSEILDHARMNKPGQGFYKVLAESALRAIRLCQPLRVPTTGYERWKEIQLNFDAREMLQG